MRARVELLLPLGETGQRPCPDCLATMRHRLARVAVRYCGWGFRATDTLIADSRGNDYTALRERTERISDD